MYLLVVKCPLQFLLMNLLIIYIVFLFNPINFISFLLMQHFFQGTNVNSKMFIRNIFVIVMHHEVICCLRIFLSGCYLTEDEVSLTKHINGWFYSIHHCDCFCCWSATYYVFNTFRLPAYKIALHQLDCQKQHQ